MSTDNILDSADRIRMHPQQQHSQHQVHHPPSTSRHPLLASIQTSHVQSLPSSSSEVQTQTQASQDASGMHAGNIPCLNVSQGSNVPPLTSIGSPLRHYPPSSFQPNNYPGQYTLSQQLPSYPTAQPPTYPQYTHAHGYGPHFPLESGPYQHNLPGFRPMMQTRSLHNVGALSYPSSGNSGMHSAANSPTTHSPLPVHQPFPGTSVSHSISQYQPVHYPGPYTPYRYNHAYQPSPYQWHYSSPVLPGFNEGIPMHYQLQYPINFAPLQDSHSPDLEAQFSQVSIHGRPNSPVQSTAQPATLPARHPHQVTITAPPSSSASNSPVTFTRTESHASPPPTVTSPSCPHSERPVVRRPHHPNPPSHRSEWVMWVGNVPSGTTHDELWRFLKRPLSVDDNSFESEDNGVLSIFLISRSNCAFVNFDTEEHLRRAIVQFNGQQLHPHDRRGPRLVCRVRRKEDDLRAGVGGQRGVGMHTRYVREQSQQGQIDKQVAPSEDDQSSSPGRRSSLSNESEHPLAVAASLQSSDEEAARAHQCSQHGDSVKTQSSSSYASTNSSFLSRHFPKRFFILKSLTQFDLDLSVENGLWATQKHNEAILDQAYRTSSDVILIFSVNKSGEFYGYARMAGRILKGKHRVSWASHADPSATSISSPQREPSSSSPLVAPDQTFFTPSENRLVEESPMPFTPHSGGNLSNKPSPMEPHRSSAPAALGPHPRQEFSAESPIKKLSLRESGKAMPVAGLISKDFVNATPEIVLDKNAPIRAIRNEGSMDGTKSVVSALQSVEEENNSISSNDGDDGGEKPKDDAMPSMTENAGSDEQQTWGQPFKVEWLCTDRLPFHSTRHLRNPWNQDREIKVSRDGTEVEPGVGQQLLEQWRTLAAAPIATETSKSSVAMGRRAAKPTSTLTPAAVNSGDCGQS
ncbi:YT521-B-like domain-containing protein [Suillus bovinus]|uniref:YT521-B-like domain-containing protein n=1 Tax=Suillus bovinus TaxID=48563 RepID=UPI001B85ED77|nr:YT521-B-like domain-containing protein [Suillus bovinus]KAG2141166.1 YT521-B-like domain-containing protein [Suillus bovinus]